MGIMWTKDLSLSFKMVRSNCNQTAKAANLIKTWYKLSNHILLRADSCSIFSERKSLAQLGSPLTDNMALENKPDHNNIDK